MKLLMVLKSCSFFEKSWNERCCGLLLLCLISLNSHGQTTIFCEGFDTCQNDNAQCQTLDCNDWKASNGSPSLSQNTTTDHHVNMFHNGTHGEGIYRELNFIAGAEYEICLEYVVAHQDITLKIGLHNTLTPVDPSQLSASCGSAIPGEIKTVKTYSYDPGVGSAWQKASFSFTPTTSYTQLWLYASPTTSTSSKEWVRVDSIYVKETLPEWCHENIRSLIGKNALNDVKFSESGYSIKQTSDCGYIMAGSISDADFVTSNEQMLLVKTDSQGIVEWAKRYFRDTPSVQPPQGALYNVIETSDLGFAVTGYHKYVNKDLVVFKTNSLGVVQWASSYGDDADDIGYDIEELSDGSLVVCGTWDERFVWVKRLRANGTHIWSRKWGDHGVNGPFSKYVAHAIEPYDTTGDTAHDGIMLCGFAQPFQQGQLQDSSILVMKIDTGGQLLKSKLFDDEDHENQVGMCLKQESGFGQSNSTWGITGHHEFKASHGMVVTPKNTDILLIRFLGKTVTSTGFDFYGQNRYDEYGEALELTNNNQYVIAGHLEGHNGLKSGLLLPTNDITLTKQLKSAMSSDDQAYSLEYIDNHRIVVTGRTRSAVPARDAFIIATDKYTFNICDEYGYNIVPKTRESEDHILNFGNPDTEPYGLPWLLPLDTNCLEMDYDTCTPPKPGPEPFQEATAMKDVSTMTSVNVYPNPARTGEVLSIDVPKVMSETVHLTLVHVSGKVVLNDRTHVEDHQIKLPLLASPGLYFLEVRSDASTYAQKVLIQD